MQIITILNRIYPFKGFVYKKVTFRDNPFKELVATIVPRKNSQGICSKCNRKSPGYDRLPVRYFSFIPLWNIRVGFEYSPRRVECKDHGVVVEHMPWVSGKHHATIAFQVYLSQWARLLSWQEVARRFNVSWDVVCDSIKMVVDFGLTHRSMDGIKSIGVDEISVGKGHKYVTLVYQIDLGIRRLLWIGEERKVKTFLRFFMDLGKERCANISFVCSDMWKPYLKVIAKKIPQALNILDRFHIMQKFSFAIDEVRSSETAELRKNGYEPILTKSRWLLLKRPENLTSKQGVRLKTILGYNLKSIRSYLLKEEFQQFWTYQSAMWAGKFLDEWIRKTMLSKIEPMKKVAKMLRRHKPLIMNWFVAKGSFSSGVVEALNNTAKLTIKRSYGFRQYETLKYALYHKLGELPIPKSTHEFF